MALNFNSSGSTAGSPRIGLLGNPKAGQQPGVLGGLFNVPNFNKQQQAVPSPIPVPKPETPVKKTTQTNPDGSSTVHEYHAPEKTNSGLISPSNTQTKQNEPQVNDQEVNAQRVINSSDLSNNPEYQNLAQMNNQLTQQQSNAQTAGKGGIPIAGLGTNNSGFQNLFAPQTTASLEGRQNLFNTNNSIQMAGNAAEAGRLLQAGQLGTQGAQSVLSAGAPGQLSGSARLYSPLGNINDNSNNSGIIEGANNQSTYDLQNQYNQGKVALATADGIKNQILGTLQNNPTLNNQPISAITNLSEFFSGQSSAPGQQLLSQQVANYIQTLGLDPASVVNIAHQQQGTLAQLLDSLHQTAVNQNEAHNPANLNIGSHHTNSSTSPRGGAFGWDTLNH